MRKKLGKLLIGKGLLTEPQLTEALEEQVVHGGRLGSILVELGHLAPEALAAALSEQVGLPSVEAEELQRLLPALPQVLTREQLGELLGIPLRLEGRTLHIAMVDPRNLTAVDAVQYATDLRLQLYVVAEGLFWNFAEPHLGLERPGFKRGRGRSWARSKPLPQRQEPVARRSGQPVANRARPAPLTPPDGPPRLVKPAAPPPDPGDGPPPLELPADLLRDLRSSSDLFGPSSQVVGGKAPSRPGGISSEQLDSLRSDAPQLEAQLEPPAGEYGGLELAAPEGLDFDGLELATAPGELEEAPELLVGVMLEPDAGLQLEGHAGDDEQEAPPYSEEDEQPAPAFDDGEEPAPPYVEEYATEPPPPADEEEDVFASRTTMRPLAIPQMFRDAALAEEPEPPPVRTRPVVPVPERAPLPQPGSGRPRPGFSSTPTRNVALAEPTPPPAPQEEELEDASNLPTGIVERPQLMFQDDPPDDSTGVALPRPSDLFSDEEPRTASGNYPLVLIPFAEILGDLNAATHREEVADALRAYARCRTERMVLLYLRRDAANGFVCEGTGLAQERVIQLSVSLLTPSAFQRARETRLPYIGPPIPGEATDVFQRWLGPPVPTEVVVIPIRIDARVVNLLYLDNGVESLGTAVQLEGLKLSAACAAAYERILARAREGSKA